MEDAPQTAARPHQIEIVAVGASAGGLEALTRFLTGFTEQDVPPIVIVTHLAPDQESFLHDILSRRSPIPVVQVQNEVYVERGRGYVIPPGRQMIVSGGRLLLTDREPGEMTSLPIDTFFRSLATDYGRTCAAVVLSGTGRDGSRGLLEVSSAGGIVLVQEPGTAAFASMPEAALDAVVADVIAPPEEMGAAIASISQGMVNPTDESWDREFLGQIFDAIRAQSGVDFRQYKSTTVLRRLQRRMSLLGVSSLRDYASLLASDSDEVETLYQDLLIGVTRFFRDAEAFEVLRPLLRKMVKDSERGEQIRVWVAGCASGEEAYTMAMLLHEAFRELRRPSNFRVFATDLHRGSLDFASAGRYPADSVRDVPQSLVERYLVMNDDSAQVTKELRDVVVFARHDVTRDPPFTRVDLVACRNLLIYFRGETQRRVMTLFHFALRTNGILLLGSSETPGRLADEFESLDRRWRLYRKKRDIRLHPDFRASVSVPPVRRARQIEPTELALNALVDAHAPPTLLVNKNGVVLHAYAGGARFLRPVDGPPTMMLLDLLTGELKNAVSAALQTAKRNERTTWYRGIRTISDGEPMVVDVQASPLVDAEGTILVNIRPRDEEVLPEAAPTAREDLAAERVTVLEHELRETRENLQTTMEEMETANEELQATNEELIASNEELQSTNEELNSVNEELYTVNAEYHDKIDELQRLSRDMEYVLEGSDVHVLFLDREYRIRDFTQGLRRLIGLVDHDVGRSMSLFAPQLTGSDWVTDLDRVAREDVRITHEVIGPDGALYQMRITPYRTARGIDGVVLVLSNQSDMRELEAQRRRLAAVVAESPDLIFTFDAEGHVREISAGVKDRMGPLDEVESVRIEDYVKRPRDFVDAILTPALAADIWQGEVVVQGKDGPIECSAVVMCGHEVPGHPRQLSMICRDIGELKERERARQEEARRKDLFLAALSHELRNPVAAMVHAIELVDMGDQVRTDRAVTVVRRQLAGLRRLVDDLLDSSRISQGEINLRRERVELGQVLQSAMDAIEIMYPDAEVRCELPPEPLWLEIDPARMQQVMSNLLTNGVRYGEDRPIQLSVQVSEDTVRIRVQDQGRGLKEADLKAVFDPYYRVSQEDVHGAVGIGLNLSRHLVELHGGWLWAESPGLGQGSTFIAEFPRGEATQEAPADSIRPAPVAGTYDFLLVDDNTDLNEALGLLLEAAGHSVRLVETLEETRAALRERTPTVLLCDIGLPDGTGLDLAKAFAGDLARPQVALAVSGYGQDKDIQASKEAGFDDHLVKPVALPELMAAIQAHIEADSSA